MKDTRPQINLDDLMQIRQMFDDIEKRPQEIWMNSTMLEIAKKLPEQKLTTTVSAKTIIPNTLVGLKVMIDDSLPDGYFESDLEREKRLK